MLHENECRLCDLSPSEHIYDKSIFGIYPGVVSSIPLDYGATDQIEEFQVTFNYIYWTVESGSNITG